MWEIEVWTPDRATSKAVYSAANPGGIAGGMRWSVAPNGNGRLFVFHAKPAAVNIGPRDLVQLRIDGTPAFFGFVEQSWPSGDTSLREYRAVGASELLAQRIYDGKPYAKQDVGAIVRDIAQRLLPPAIQYDAALIPDTGWSLALQGGLGVSLARVFGDLAKATDPPLQYGVDARGRFFFKAASGSVVVDSEGLERRAMPLDASEIVTAAVVLVGGIAVRYEAPEHARYGAEKAWVYPVTTDMKVDRLETRGITEETRDGGLTWAPWSGDTSILFDTDPRTGVRIPSGGDIQLFFDTPTHVDSVYVKLETPNNDALVWWKLEDGTTGTYTIPQGSFDGAVPIGAKITQLVIQPVYQAQLL